MTLSTILLIVLILLLIGALPSWPHSRNWGYVPSGGLGLVVLVVVILLLMGWISGIILGQTFKTLPFIVWNNQYKQINGKVKVPLPKHLYSAVLLRYQSVLFWPAMVLLVTGLLAGSLFITRLAFLIWLMVVVICFLTVGKILLHKTKTVADEAFHK